MCPAISEHLFMIDPFFGFRSDGGLGITEEKKLVEKKVHTRAHQKKGACYHSCAHCNVHMYTIYFT